jgi:hypothetical protein
MSFSIRRDQHGHAVAVEREGYTIFHLQAGTERNEEEIEKFIKFINQQHEYLHIAVNALKNIRDMDNGIFEEDYYKMIEIAKEAIERIDCL